MEHAQPTIEDLERQLEAINDKLEPLLISRDHIQDRINIRKQELYKAQIGLSPQAKLKVTQEFIDNLDGRKVAHWGWVVGEPCGIYQVDEENVVICSGQDGTGSYVVRVPTEIAQRMALAPEATGGGLRGTREG